MKPLPPFDPNVYESEVPITKDKNGKEYGVRNGRKFNVMSKANTQIQMGIVSNLITDMTLGGANTDELYRAVKHSMVVIDANKHGLDYQQSYKNNQIRELIYRWRHRSKSFYFKRFRSYYFIQISY